MIFAGLLRVICPYTTTEMPNASVLGKWKGGQTDELQAPLMAKAHKNEFVSRPKASHCGSWFTWFVQEAHNGVFQQHILCILH